MATLKDGGIELTTLRVIKDSDGYREFESAAGPVPELNRPYPRRRMALGQVRTDGVVEVWASPGLLSTLREFGRIEEDSNARGLYLLTINPRYDTGEVLGFLRRIGEGVR